MCQSSRKRGRTPASRRTRRGYGRGMRAILLCLALLLVGFVTGCGDDRGAVFETESDEKRDLKLKEIRKEIDTLGDGRDPNDVEKDVRADRAKNLLIARGTRIEPQLIEALGAHEDWAVRVGVIEVLEALGTRSSIEALITATGDEHPLVALKADKLLEVMCQHREIPTAAEGVGANDLPPFVGPAADDLALDARERAWATWHGANRESLRKAWSAWWATNRTTAQLN